MKRIFVPLTKVDAVERMVYGVAVIGDVEDKQGEVFDYEGSKPFFEEWSAEIHKASFGKSYGNIRAMHNKVAAGFLPGPLGFDDTSKVIEVGAKVVDDNEWAKVEAGVYTGFSFGGKYVKQWTDGSAKKRYIASPVEISLVDNPAIPGANFQVIKMDGAVEDRPFLNQEKAVTIITNDQVVARAQEIAKAAGAKNFSDFIEQGRVELELNLPVGKGADAEIVAAARKASEHGAAEGDSTQSKGDGGKDHQHGGTEHDGNAPKAKTGESGDSPRAEGDGSGGDQQEHGKDEGDSSKKKGSPAAASTEQPGKAAGDLRDVLKQVWLAPDGSTHEKKADALAHVAKGANPVDALNAALANMKSAINKDASPDNGNASTPEKAKDEDDGDKKASFEGAAPKFKKKKAKATDKAARALEVRKSLYDVSRLVYIIEDLNWLSRGLADEASWEGDNSAIPGQIKSHVAGLVAVLKALVDEETGELFSDEESELFGELLELAALPGPLLKVAEYVTKNGSAELQKTAGFATIQKAGARHSKADVEKIQQVHDHAVALGATCDGDDDSDKHAHTEVNKAATDRITELEKREVSLLEVVTKATDAINALTGEIEILKNSPTTAQPTRLVVVGKGEDNPEYSRAKEASAFLNTLDPNVLATAAIKVSQAQGGRMFRFGTPPAERQ